MTRSTRSRRSPIPPKKKKQATPPPGFLSTTTPEFRALLDELPQGVQKVAKRAYETLFCIDPRHPLLKGKTVRDKRLKRDVWRVWINREYRAMATMIESDGLTEFRWYWCGSHEDYNNRT